MTDEKESTFLVTHVESDSAVLKDTGRWTLSSNPGSVDDALEATVAPDPPMEVTYQIVEIMEQRALDSGKRAPTVHDDASSRPRRRPASSPARNAAGVGEIHVLTPPEEDTADAVSDVIDDREATLAGGSARRVNRVEVRSGRSRAWSAVYAVARPETERAVILGRRHTTVLPRALARQPPSTSPDVSHQSTAVASVTTAVSTRPSTSIRSARNAPVTATVTSTKESRRRTADVDELLRDPSDAITRAKAAVAVRLDLIASPGAEPPSGRERRGWRSTPIRFGTASGS